MRRWNQRMLRRPSLEQRAKAVEQGLVEALTIAADPSVVIGAGTDWSIDVVCRIAKEEFGTDVPDDDARQMLSMALVFERRGMIPAIDTIRSCLRSFVKHRSGAAGEPIP